MSGDDIFHRDFKATPYWWDAHQPTAMDPLDRPPRVRVAIIGGGTVVSRPLYHCRLSSMNSAPR
jgi:hypothetical protein